MENIAERPDVVKPVQPSNFQERILDISARSDSVSVALRLRLELDVRNVVVLWGDGSQTNREIRHGFFGTSAFPAGEPLPPGTFEFVHVYQPDRNENEYIFDGTFTRTIVAIASDADADIDVRTVDVTLEPRIRCDIFPVSVRQLSPCDVESNENTFRLKLTREGVTLKEEWTIKSNFFPTPWRLLEGSGFSQVITPKNGELGVGQTLTIVETDPIFSESGSTIVGMDYRQEDGDKERKVYLSDKTGFGRCEMEVMFFARSRPVVPFSEDPPLVAAIG